MTRTEVIGLRELRTAIFYRRLVAEAVGTAILVIFGCGSAMTVNPSLAPTVISIAVAFGLTVATVIWSVGSVSGAHINPCVTLAMFATRKISLTRCIGYIIVQCVGGIVGAAILWGLTPSYRRGTLGVTLVAEEVSVFQGLVVEVIATFILVLAIFATCDTMRSDHSGSAGLSIGFVVTMDIPWAIQYTGASMNPARSLGPCVMTGLWQDHWVFWMGPIVGALLAGCLYHFVFDQRLLHGHSQGSCGSQRLSPLSSHSDGDLENSDRHDRWGEAGEKVFWVGPIVGALAAGLLYEFVFHQRHLQVKGQAEDGDLELEDNDLNQNKNGPAHVKVQS